MKRILCIVVAILLAAVMLASCATTETPAESSAAASEATAAASANDATAADSGDTIKIGVLAPTTGAFAALGEDAMEGVKMAFEGINYEIGGRKVELFFEDTQADPTICIQKVQRLVEREGVQLILGPLSGGEGTALKDYADSIPDVTLLVCCSAAENVTMRGLKDNIYRSAITGAQVSFEFGNYCYNELGYKKMVTLGENYDFPFSEIGGFIETYTMAGGEVPQRLWVEVGTTDYSSVIAQIPDDIDALFTLVSGTDSINFIKQLEEFGRADDFDIVAGSTTVDSTTLASDAGKYFDGVISTSQYSQELPFDEFKAFDNAFMERTGRPSGIFSSDYYIGGIVAIQALQAVNGNIEDQDAFRSALGEVEMMTPRGPFKFDDYRNSVVNVYFSKVQYDEENDVYRNVTFKTIENQTQFGPFDSDWYQSQPEYDTENPTVETIQGAVLASGS